MKTAKMILRWITARTTRNNFVRHLVAKLLSSATLLCFCAGAARAASGDIYLGDSLRQLGLHELEQKKGDPAEAERHGAKGGIGLYAERNRDYLWVDGIKLYLNETVGLAHGKLTVSRLDYEKILVPLYWKLPTPMPGAKRIIIDPGHGGKDPGKQNAALNYNEKAATLDTAIRLKLILDKLGFEVILTREKDVAIELDQRAPIAIKNKADLFVSLHYNGGAKGDTNSSGIETYCLSPAGQHSTNAARGKADTSTEAGNRFDACNLQLAWSIQRRIIAGTGAEDRGVRRARFAVLRTLNCPGVLVEGGFISSKSEGAQIANPAYRQKIAEAVAAGISDYAQRLQSKQ